MSAAADLVLEAARVVVPGNRPARAVAVRAGRVLTVGDRPAVESVVGASTRRLRLGDAVVLPGWVDAHGHVLAHGHSLERIDLGAVWSFDEAIERVRSAAAAAPAGSWILGQGWDHTRWPGSGLPVHDRLSRAVPEHPVYLRRVDMHAVLVNAAAMSAAGLTRHSVCPAGGEIVRDAAGEPTGILVDTAAGLVDRVLPPPTEAAMRSALRRSLRHLARHGITGVHDAGTGYAPDLGVTDTDDPGWLTVDLYRRLAAEGALPLRVYAMLGGNFAYPPPENYFERPPVIDDCDGRLTVRAVKIGIDGALGSRGAALEEPYDDAPGSRGLTTRGGELVERVVRRGLETGWQIAVHAIGDRANRLVLDAIAAARAAVPDARDPRPRIEHAQILRLEDMPRFRELGVIASVQPVHAASDHRWVERRLGSRVRGAYAYRSLRRHGAVLACGSDFPVETPDPRAGLLAAVARQDASGRPSGGWRPEESLDLEEALEGYTRGAARAAYTERESGTIAPGMRADFTVLDRDPAALPPSDLGRLAVRMTVVGGEIVFDAAV